ncbi:MAG TPA: alanine racemase [Bacillota bacterium]|nr:alanine racemase [Bacillota bacterium]
MLPEIGPAWIEVDLDAIAANVAAVRALLKPATRLLAVVKADAYGHGAVECARCCQDAGADGLAVSTLPEALELRAHAIDAPILVMTPLQPHEAATAVAAAITPTLVSADAANALQHAAALAGRRPAVHIKCDTGMGRYGVLPAGLAELLRAVAACDRLDLEGVFTHIASAFASDLAPARAQLARFVAAVEAAQAAAGVRVPMRHAAASAAVLTLPEAELEMVRVGNLLYGIRPCAHGRKVALKTAFRARAEAAQVKVLPPNHGVGYGSAFVTRRATRVATIPVGLADGLGMEPATRLLRLQPLLRAMLRRLLRRLGLERRLGLGAGAGGVAFDGHDAPVLGRMAMQQTTVDVTALPGVEQGSVADLFVRPTAASARLARMYLRDGVAVAARTLAGELDLRRAPAIAERA